MISCDTVNRSCVASTMLFTDTLALTEDVPVVNRDEPATIVMRNTFVDLPEDRVDENSVRKFQSEPVSRSRSADSQCSQRSTDVSDGEARRVASPKDCEEWYTSKASIRSTYSCGRGKRYVELRPWLDKQQMEKHSLAHDWIEKDRGEPLDVEAMPPLMMRKIRSRSADAMSMAACPTMSSCPTIPEDGDVSGMLPLLTTKTTLASSTPVSPRSSAATSRTVSFSSTAEVVPILSIESESSAASLPEPSPAKTQVADTDELCVPPAPPGEWAACVAERLASMNPAMLTPAVARTPADIVETVRKTLEKCSDQVACVEAKQGPRGWNITAYVRHQVTSPGSVCAPARVQKKVLWDYILHVAKQAVLYAAGASDNVFILGYDASPFFPMSLGFGCAAACMPDEQRACWASYSKALRCRR